MNKWSFVGLHIVTLKYEQTKNEKPKQSETMRGKWNKKNEAFRLGAHNKYELTRMNFI